MYSVLVKNVDIFSIHYQGRWSLRITVKVLGSLRRIQDG